MQMIKENILLKCFIAIVAAVLLFGIDSYAQTPDSLKVTTGLDTLKTNLADTLAVAQDSLAAGADSLAAKKDSVEVKVLSQKEIRKLQRDTIRMRRDSAIKNTPRILLTYVFTDTIKNQRMFLWNADTYFNKPVNIDPDTTYNDWFVETPDRKMMWGQTILVWQVRQWSTTTGSRDRSLRYSLSLSLIFHTRIQQKPSHSTIQKPRIRS